MLLSSLTGWWNNVLFKWSSVSSDELLICLGIVIHAGCWSASWYYIRCTNENSPFIFGRNLGECRLVYQILSLADSPRNSPHNSDRRFHLSITTLLHYLVKFEADILSTSLSSRTGLWHIEHGKPSICWSEWHQGFIPHSLWPPSSLDVNPVDCAVWEILQDRVYKNHILDVEELRQSVQGEWNCHDQRVIDSAIREWRKTLQACIAADRGHFQHTLSTLCTFIEMQLMTIWLVALTVKFYKVV